VLSAVHIPTIEQDDQRRLMRERQRLVKERTAHSNRIKGLLMTQGIIGFDPRGRDAIHQLDDLVTGDGRRLGPRLKDELRRELVRLRLVMEQLAAVEAERDAIARAEKVAAPSTEEARADLDAKMIAALNRIRGVGTNDASVLVREAFGASSIIVVKSRPGAASLQRPGPAERRARTRASPSPDPQAFAPI
jgi:transposase